MTDPEHADPERYVQLASFGTGYRDLWWNPDFLALTAQRWSTKSARRVLDVGCGDGGWTRTVGAHLAPDAELVGVDREQHFVDLAATSTPNATFQRAEAESLPFEDGSFDLVTCQTVLIHVADAAKVVAEMHRVVRPGGVVLIAEPDNLAGGMALLGATPAVSDEVMLAHFRLLLTCQRGKAALGEGDERIGCRLPGIFAAAGLEEVNAHVNDRCVVIHPPYETPQMKLALGQEASWARDDISTLFGLRSDAKRLFVAGGGEQSEFDDAWAPVRAHLNAVEAAISEQRYHAGRGFVMYVVGGRSPR